MSNQFEDFQKTSKTQLEGLTASAETFTKGMKTVAAETVDYSKRSIESSKSFVEKLQGVKSFETAIQLQSEFAKSQFEDFIAQMTKIGEIYKDMGKEIFKPVEAAIAKGTDAVQH